MDGIAKEADKAFELMLTPLGAPSVDLLTKWVDLTEYYKEQWDASPDEVKDRAADLSDRLFYGSLVSWGGFEKARTGRGRLDTMLLTECATALCLDGTKDAIQKHLLHHLSAHRAYLVQLALGEEPSLVLNPEYVSASNRLFPSTKEFKLQTERDQIVRAGLIEGEN